MRVLVCRGVTCTGFLADDVHRALRLAVVDAKLAPRVEVERGGCFARCGGGVTVVVREAPDDLEAEPFGGDPAGRDVVYPELTPADARRIVDEHLAGGAPVVELTIARRGAKSDGSGCAR